VSRDSSELTTTEQYVLARLLICGEVTPTEYENASKFSRTVREETLDSLDSKGYFNYILYQCQTNNSNYERQTGTTYSSR